MPYIICFSLLLGLCWFPQPCDSCKAIARLHAGVLRSCSGCRILLLSPAYSEQVYFESSFNHLMSITPIDCAGELATVFLEGQAALSWQVQLCQRLLKGVLHSANYLRSLSVQAAKRLPKGSAAPSRQLRGIATNALGVRWLIFRHLGNSAGVCL